MDPNMNNQNAFQFTSDFFGLLSKFCFETLEPRWVMEVTNSDFNEIEDLPPEFVEIHSTTNFVGLLNATVKSLRDWIDEIPKVQSCDVSTKRESMSFLSTTSLYESEVEDRTIVTQFWVDITKIFDMKSILSYIFFNVYKAQSYDASEEMRELGCLSSSLYLLMLSVPGSNAFRVFHPVLYLKSLDILRLSTKLNIAASSPKKGISRTSKSMQRKSVEDAVEEESEEMTFLNPQETSKLVRSLNIVLNDFIRFLTRFSLKHSPESFGETLTILVDVTRAETHNPHSIFLNRHSANTATALAYNAYVALQNVCVSLHGNVEKTVILIMKLMMHHILMNSRGTSDLSARALGVIREHSVIFVKYLFIQVKDPAQRGIYFLLQQLCLRGPDRADCREKTAKAVVDILKKFSVNIYTDFLKWLYQFSHGEKAGYRLFSLEVILKLLEEEERVEPEHNEVLATETIDIVGNSLKSVQTNSKSTESLKQNVLSHRFLLGIIFSRCRDSAATVRAKSLALLATCTLSANPTIVLCMKEIFAENVVQALDAPDIPNADLNCESQEALTDASKQLEFPTKEMLISILKHRALDGKVTVRKSALQVVENLMKMDISMVSTNQLEILEKHCRDPALLIRKQMIVSLTTILKCYPSSSKTCSKWVLGVLPLVLDPEIKVQEKVIEVVDSVMFNKLQPNDEDNCKEHLCWEVMNEVISCSYMKFLSKILMLWSKSELIRPKIFGIIKTYIGSVHNEQAWTLLALLSQYMQVKQPIFALEYFEEHCKDISEISSYALQQVLKVLQHSIKHIPKERAFSLQEKLLQYINRFTLGVELISLVIDSITLISYTMADEGSARSNIDEWTHPILQACDTHLQGVLFSNTNRILSDQEEELFYRHLYTIGEIAMLCPSKVNNRMFLMLQSIIFHNTHSTDKQISPQVPSSQTQTSQTPTVNFTPTKRLKALAVATLGKLCLQHENQAKRIVPAFGKLLDTTSLPPIKINILFVLTDMCVRYATLVDPLMPQVTACLRDSDVQVRRTALTLLIHLLQEDYLKLKGAFFYRILQCLCDSHDDIRSTVIFFLTERLLKRSPNIFLQHFIECIFHYNRYEEHESYNRFTQSEQEKKLFSLTGPAFKEQRMILYKFMLDHMSDEQRFTTTQKLCQDILGGIVNGRIGLTAASQPMLEDTLLVLSSEEIKLASLKCRSDDLDQPTDRVEEAQLAGIAVRKTIISQVVKKNVIENIVPILISLKHRFEENKSSLMKQLLLYIKDIMKDYKNEVREILAGDKQLAKEIEFDLRRIDEQQQKEREHPAMHVASAGPSEQTIPEEASEDEVEIPVSPLVKPRANTPSMLKKALVNSQNVIERRRSVKKEEGTVLRRKSISDISSSESHKGEEIATYTPIKCQTQDKKREQLLRAISTPNASESILQNITFINKTQEVSAICFEKTQVGEEDNDDPSETILLHLKSPEAFVKDQEFSMLRRAPRRSIVKEFQVPAEVKANIEPGKGRKRSSCGLFESYSNRLNDCESETSTDTSSIFTSLRCSPRIRQLNTVNAEAEAPSRRLSKRNASSSSGETNTSQKKKITKKRPKRK